MKTTSQRGFVLVATLWILAIITIAATYFAERVNTSMAMARQKQETAEQLIEFGNTRADILYRLGTTHFSFHGLGDLPAPIALDGRPYQGSGNDIVRLQDERGLLSLNFVERGFATRLLGELGIPVEKRDAMVDTLLDYTDLDDLRRLNGAESQEYAGLGLPTPPNQLLLMPYQLKNVLGWRDQSALWDNQRLTGLVSTSRVNGFNPNTAPLELLASLPGSNRELASTMIKLRTEKPFYNTAQLTAVTGFPLDSDFFLFFPGHSIRITHQSSRLPWGLQYSVTLTPTNDLAPWRIDYHIKTLVPVGNAENFSRLPAYSQPLAGRDEAL